MLHVRQIITNRNKESNPCLRPHSPVAIPTEPLRSLFCCILEFFFVVALLKPAPSACHIKVACCGEATFLSSKAVWEQGRLPITNAVHREVVKLKPVYKLRIAMRFWSCNGQMSHRVTGVDQRERERKKNRRLGWSVYWRHAIMSLPRVIHAKERSIINTANSFCCDTPTRRTAKAEQASIPF
jgi:hypothetical protein